jgi:hypothetical protein
VISSAAAAQAGETTAAAAATGVSPATMPEQHATQRQRPYSPHVEGPHNHSSTSRQQHQPPLLQQQQQQQQLGSLARHAKRKRASVQAIKAAHAAGSTAAADAAGTSSAKRTKAAAAAAAVTSAAATSAPSPFDQCDSLTHIVLQLPEHGTSTWHTSTGGGSSSSGGAGSSSDGGSRGGVKGSTTGDAVNGNVQLLLNQLQAYQQQLDTAGSLPSHTQPAGLQPLTDTPGDPEQQTIHAAHSQQQQQEPQQLQVVSAAWLESVLSTGRHVPEASYSLNHLLQQQQRHGGRLATAAAALAGPIEGGVSHGVADSGAGVLHRLPDLSNLPDAPLGR